MFSSAFFKHFRVLVNNIYFPPLYFAIKKNTKITPFWLAAFACDLWWKPFHNVLTWELITQRCSGTCILSLVAIFVSIHIMRSKKIANKCSWDIFPQLTFNLEMDFWNRSFVPSVMWEWVKELKMNSWQFRYFRNIWILFNTQMVQATYLV